MTARDHKDLQCWRLADALRREVHAICEIPVASRDFRFCDGFRDAAGSVCRNLSEGFARFSSPEIVKFFRYALASLEEVKDHLEECRTRGLLAPPDYDRIYDLAQHTKATALNFKKCHETRCQDQRASRGKRGANPRR